MNISSEESVISPKNFCSSCGFISYNTAIIFN